MVKLSSQNHKKIKQKQQIRHNQQKSWMRVYNFKLLKSIRRLYNPNLSNKYYLSKVKTIPQQLFVQKLPNQPIKILLKNKISMKFPKQLQATIHSSHVLQYQGQSKFMMLSLNDILNFQGKAKVSVPQMELSSSRLQIPKIVSQTFNLIHKINLWFYTGFRISDWHYDGHDNYLFMVEGCKIVYLAQPRVIKSRSVFSLFNNHARNPKKFEKDNENQAQFKIWRSVVNPKQSLFIPRGWWHKVISIGKPSIAVNFWGNSLTQVLKISKTDKKILLKELLFQQIENKCISSFQHWEQLPEDKKEQIRMSIGYSLCLQGFA